MRWSIIRLIWLRELRDQLRDRRTIFMVVVLPVLLYPILGIGVVEFALGFIEKPSTVGICGADNLPQPSSGSERDYPPLLEGGEEQPRFLSAYLDDPEEAEHLQITILPVPPALKPGVE